MLSPKKNSALEQQADLRNEVRARSVACQVHGHLKLWRGKEGVGAAGLAVKFVGLSSGSNQVGVGRGFARYHNLKSWKKRRNLNWSRI